MSMLTLTPREAKTRFDKFEALFDAAQQEPVTITDGGKILLVIAAPDDLAQLAQEQERRAAVAEYDAYMAKVREEMNPDAKPLTEEEVNQLVHELR